MRHHQASVMRPVRMNSTRNVSHPWLPYGRTGGMLALDRSEAHIRPGVGPPPPECAAHTPLGMQGHTPPGMHEAHTPPGVHQARRRPGVVAQLLERGTGPALRVLLCGCASAVWRLRACGLSEREGSTSESSPPDRPGRDGVAASSCLHCAASPVPAKREHDRVERRIASWPQDGHAGLHSDERVWHLATRVCASSARWRLLPGAIFAWTILGLAAAPGAGLLGQYFDGKGKSQASPSRQNIARCL